MFFARKSPAGAFTLTEITIALAIVAILGGMVVMTLSGLTAKDSVDRASQQIFDDLIYIRSRAISTNRIHRLNFTNTDRWQLESQDPVTLAWSQTGDVRRMPTSTRLTDPAFANAGENLWATPRGIYQFQGACVGDPYVTVTAVGAAKTKSINVDVGGAIALVTN